MSNTVDYPIAIITGFTDYCVRVYCPYCGMIHMHGREGGAGHVSSHCLIRIPGDVGYVIPQFDTYDPISAAELEKSAKEKKKRMRRERRR